VKREKETIWVRKAMDIKFSGRYRAEKKGTGLKYRT
jgi:hypothetical protein